MIIYTLYIHYSFSSISPA